MTDVLPGIYEDLSTTNGWMKSKGWNGVSVVTDSDSSSKTSGPSGSSLQVTLGQVVKMEIDYTKVPADHMVDGVQAWVERGRPGGSFLHAILTNDLRMAFAKADNNNKARMEHWVEFLHWEIPSDSSGSVEKVRVWQAMHGWFGKK